MEYLVEITPEGGGGWRLESRMVIDRPRDQIFPFFADAANLERITPSFLRFEITTDGPLVNVEGLVIDYRLRLHGVPLRWQSRIAAWDPPRRFVDMQIRGPYALWHHEHRFAQLGDATLCADTVHYRLRGGAALGRVQNLLAARDLRRIFAYRQRELTRLLG